MSSNKPSIPKGTRDFSPVEMIRRNYIFDTIKKVFQMHGYQPIETPAMETVETLLGKYGEEGDRLIFRVLNSGDFLSKIPDEIFTKRDSSGFSGFISGKALRYDLTVPFARYVVKHRNEINFPFKRYQIQPVWRADKPQRGRYREFYQCDVDVIGSNSLLNEAELICIIDEVFRKLNINTITKINNRKILSGIVETLGESENLTQITVAIDKLDKIGVDGVEKELRSRGISGKAVDKLMPVILLKSSNEEKLTALRQLLAESETGLQGIYEVKTMLDWIEKYNLHTPVEFDISLARGLDYYTGAIIEVKSKDVKIGSICGGGRYDDLTGVFGLSDVSGVGISFGADRIYDVLEKTNAFPKEAVTTTQVMFLNFGDKESAYCLENLLKIRKNGIIAELFPEPVKMKKQMSYANSKSIPLVVLAGEREMEEQVFNIKDMDKGEQFKIEKEKFTGKIMQILKAKYNENS